MISTWPERFSKSTADERAAFDLTQCQFKADRSGRGIFQIGRYFAKAELPIEGLRLQHDRKCVEAHLGVANGTGLGDCRVDERASGAFATKNRLDVQSLHFTNSIFQVAQTNATHWRIVRSGTLT